MDNFFVFLRLLFFALLLLYDCDLLHEVETIFHLSYVLTASGNLFGIMSDASEVSRASLIFQKRF